MHQFETYLITDLFLFERLKAYENSTDDSLPVIYDVETNSKDEVLADLYGIGLCFTDQKAFYIPWRDSNGNLFWSKEDQNIIEKWLYNIVTKRGLIGHNIVYDILVTEKNLDFNFEDYVVSDTILMKHTIDEEPPFRLKELGVRELGSWADKAEDKLKEEVLTAGGKWTKDQKDMYLASTKTLGEYCCWDVIITKLLHDIYAQKIRQEGLEDLFYKEEVIPLYKEVTINMKRKGFKIDIPYFIRLKKSLENEIDFLQNQMYNSIKSTIKTFEQSLLDKEFPEKQTGNFPKAVAEIIGAPIPINKKTNKPTMASKALEKQAEAAPQFKFFYDWASKKTDKLDVSNSTDIQKLLFWKNFSIEADKHSQLVQMAQEKLWENKHGTSQIFNFRSNDHLIELFINIKGYKAIGKTDSGKPQVDDKFIDLLAKKDSVARQLSVYKKLNKLLSTYVEGILARQIEGLIYTSMLQHGTTSGRFSSRNPNLQNLPRPKDEDKKDKIDPLIFKYTNSIRQGFIAPEGYKIVDADYSALEPRCFAHMSGDEGLRNVFRSGEDLYSRVAIDVFGLQNVSANENDSNYLKNIQPSFRQKSKIFCLAVPYGAEAARISNEMGVSFKEAYDIIQKYLSTYPNLKKYMAVCNYQAKHKGIVSTEFGRVRHLKQAKSIYTLYGDKIIDYKWAKRKGLLDIRRKMKTALNNSKNFKIQGLAAHIVNRAMIQISRRFKEEDIDGWIALQVHDQVIAVVKEEHLKRACEIVEDCMENTTKISIPLIAKPQIADNLKDSH